MDEMDRRPPPPRQPPVRQGWLLRRLERAVGKSKLLFAYLTQLVETVGDFAPPVRRAIIAWAKVVAAIAILLGTVGWLTYTMHGG